MKDYECLLKMSWVPWAFPSHIVKTVARSYDSMDYYYILGTGVAVGETPTENFADCPERHADCLVYFYGHDLCFGS